MTLLPIVALPTAAACCFVAGTRVATPSGEVAIEALSVGDEVLAFRPEDGALVARVVVATLRARTRHLRVLDVDGTRIETTDEHPFWDAERRRWTRAAELDHDTVLAVRDGHAQTRPARVKASTRIELAGEAEVDVFNLTVDGPEHTFFANGVAVHNKGFDEYCSLMEMPPGDVPVLFNAYRLGSEKVTVYRFASDARVDWALRPPNGPAPVRRALLDPSSAETFEIPSCGSIPLPAGTVRTSGAPDGASPPASGSTLDAIAVETRGARVAVFGRGAVYVYGPHEISGKIYRESDTDDATAQVVPLDTELRACEGDEAPPPKLTFDALPAAEDIDYEVVTTAASGPEGSCLDVELVARSAADTRSVPYRACVPDGTWPFSAGTHFHVDGASTPTHQILRPSQPMPAPFQAFELMRVDSATRGGALPGGAELRADDRSSDTCETADACGTVTSWVSWSVTRGSGTTVAIKPGGAAVTLASVMGTSATVWLRDATYRPVFRTECSDGDGASTTAEPPSLTSFGVVALVQ